jgi:glycosyltransferase involved in cell wall biosynthesis
MAEKIAAEAKNSPGVSIVIPAYNAAATVGETLDSVLSQSFQRWEVLLIDDGSTDETLEIAGNYREKDRRIRLLSQSRAGVCAAGDVATGAA